MPSRQDKARGIYDAERCATTFAVSETESPRSPMRWLCKPSPLCARIYTLAGTLLSSTTSLSVWILTSTLYDKVLYTWQHRSLPSLDHKARCCGPGGDRGLAEFACGHVHSHAPGLLPDHPTWALFVVNSRVRNQKSGSYLCLPQRHDEEVILPHVYLLLLGFKCTQTHWTHGS